MKESPVKQMVVVADADFESYVSVWDIDPDDGEFLAVDGDGRKYMLLCDRFLPIRLIWTPLTKSVMLKGPDQFVNKEQAVLYAQSEGLKVFHARGISGRGLPEDMLHLDGVRIVTTCPPVTVSDAARMVSEGEWSAAAGTGLVGLMVTGNGLCTWTCLGQVPAGRPEAALMHPENLRIYGSVIGAIRDAMSMRIAVGIDRV